MISDYNNKSQYQYQQQSQLYLQMIGIQKQMIWALDEKQLGVLLASGMVEFQVVEVEGIESPQELLVYFWQRGGQMQEEDVVGLCRLLLNDQFQLTASHRHQQLSPSPSKSDQHHDTSSQQHQQIASSQHVYIDQSILLTPSTLQHIQSILPFSIQYINPLLIPTFSYSHCTKLLALVDIQLSNDAFVLSTQQLEYMVQEVILPIAFLHGWRDSGDCLFRCVQRVKVVMGYYGSLLKNNDKREKGWQQKQNQLITRLCQTVTKFYISKCQQQQQLTIQQIITLLTTIQACHSTTQTYHSLLLSTPTFLSHITHLLRCSNVQSKTANSIAINIYGAILKQLNLYCLQAQIFINLYSTLRCFGAHLVRDVWPVFYDFIEMEGKDIVIGKDVLVDIIFYKIQHHENANVVKHCIQSILQQPRAYILFEKMPSAIYNSLMRILNSGMHYLDCLFHMDSKMFTMISTFFAGFFNDTVICNNNQIETHLHQFLQSISSMISFDHALVSLINSFTLIIRKSYTINNQHMLQLITNIIKKYYIRNPIRKRHQLMRGISVLLENHLLTVQKGKEMVYDDNNNNDDYYYQEVKNNGCVSVEMLVDGCLVCFPQQYLTLEYNTHSTRQHVYTIIESNFTNSQFNHTIINYAQQIIQLFKTTICKEQVFQQLMKLLKSIQLVMFLAEEKTLVVQEVRCRFPGLGVETVQKLGEMWGVVYERGVCELGESLYKGQVERVYGVHIQRQCLHKLFTLQLFTPNFSTLQFIQNTLTNISHFINHSITCSQQIPHQDLQSCQFVVTKCFEMIYSQDNKQMQEKLSRVGSQFLEWAVDNVQAKESQMLVISVLKVRLVVGGRVEIDYIEESVYKVFWEIFALQYNDCKPQLKSSSPKFTTINPLLRLRLFTLCANILFSDSSQLLHFLPSLYSNLDQLADRYDFQNLDQAFNLIENVFTSIYIVNNKPSEQTAASICAIISSVIENMLQILNYGIGNKQVIACCTCIINILFTYAQHQRHFNQHLVDLALKVFVIGQQYWMFERVMSFNLINKLEQMVYGHKEMDYGNLFPLLSRLLCVEEYRGYDSAIALEAYLSQMRFYTELKLTLHHDSDYEGTTCRLALISFINSLIECSLSSEENHHKNVQVDRFLVGWFEYMMEQVGRDGGEKMFLTGEHKAKLKHWQCIMAYSAQWLYHKLPHANTHHNTLPSLILTLIHIVDLNTNLSQLKYYIQLFLMKLLINPYSLHIITPAILDKLTEKLLQLISQVNKNVSFIVIGGLVVNYLFKTYEVVRKGHGLYGSLDRLYNALLAYSCSHVAYFRGLSQYFCLQTLFIESPYTRILHQTIGQDPDTILLRDKLNVIMCEYFGEIHHWTVGNNLFKQLPTLNRNIVSDTFYMDRIKKLGQELLRQVKGEVGFLPYKDIWIEAVKTLKLTDENADSNKEKQKLTTQQAIFQRKIDPSLDFIYFSKTKLQGFEMKILITGAKKIPIYGHLSRTGEIFGLSQLIIPYKEIIEDEEFKNVACTAQKWLNISEFSNQRQLKNKEKFLLSLQKKLLKIKQEGYVFFLLKKHENLSLQLLRKQISDIQCHKKILLILDSQNYLPHQIYKLLAGVICFGKHFSEHVEASIFIWQYFKECYAEKFRTNQVKID